LPGSALAASADFTHGVASGDVTQSSAILWTRAVPIGPATNVKLEVWRESQCLTGQKQFKSKDKSMSAARDFTIKLEATGLDAGTEYCYRFRRGDEAFSPVGHFKTAPDGATAADVNISYSGDQDGTGGVGAPCCGTFPALALAAASGSDFYVSNGDNIYSDSSHRVSPATTLAEYRDAYKEILEFPNHQGNRAAQSTYALMDDHEVQNDYDGQTVSPARYAAGRQAFLEYHPVRESGLPNDPTCAGDPLYRTVKWGSDVEVFIIDTRSCRSADVAATCLGDLGPTLPPALRATPPFNIFLAPTPPAGCVPAIFDPSRTVLGPVQKNAFKNDLLNSTATFKYILNEYGMQQFHAQPYDRWEGYGAERNEILDFISNNGISNVVFLTTDHHATLQNEVFKDRFLAPAKVAHEFITGPVGTDTLAVEITNLFGPVALLAFQVILNVDAVDCRNLNQNSWGEINYDSSTGQTTGTSWKDDGSGAVTNSNPTDPGNVAACTKVLP
jgi:phosphodiesterase/alkaline phosphatase D-like protein